MTILITYIIEKFMATLESIHYVETFQSLKLKYDQEMDRVNDVQTTHDLSKLEKRINEFIIIMTCITDSRRMHTCNSNMLAIMY